MLAVKTRLLKQAFAEEDSLIYPQFPFDLLDFLIWYMHPWSCFLDAFCTLALPNSLTRRTSRLPNSLRNLKEKVESLSILAAAGAANTGQLPPLLLWHQWRGIAAEAYQDLPRTLFHGYKLIHRLFHLQKFWSVSFFVSPLYSSVIYLRNETCNRNVHTEIR